MPQVRRFRRSGIVVVLVCLLAASCTEDRRAPRSGEQVDEAGFSIRLGEAVVSAAAGVAPVGTTVEVTNRSIEEGVRTRPVEWSTIAAVAADGIDVRLAEDIQPATPVTVTLPAAAPPSDEATAALIQRSADGAVELLPARYDPRAGAMTAEATHLSSFWPTWLDPRPFFEGVADTLTGALGLSTPKPGCSGQSVQSETAGEIVLPEMYRGDGDGIVWPCLQVRGGPQERLVLTLQSNSGLPYRVRATGDPVVATGGALDPGQLVGAAAYDALLRSPDYSESLLIPTGSLILTWPTTALPVDVALKADAVTQLAIIASTALAVILGEQGNRLVETLDGLNCLSAAVDAAVPNEDDRGPAAVASAIGAVLNGVIDCAGSLAGDAGSLLLTALASGVGFLVAQVQGVWATITGTEERSFRLSPEGTQIFTLRPVDDAGVVQSGWSVTRTHPVPVSCYGRGEGALDDGLASCGFGADGLYTCWVGNSGRSGVCSYTPFERELVTIVVSDVSESEAYEPIPAGVVLSNGAECRVRHGAGNAPRDGASLDYTDMYVCDGSLRVWGLYEGDNPFLNAFDRSKPTWTAEVGRDGPASTVGVVQATYYGRA